MILVSQFRFYCCHIVKCWLGLWFHRVKVKAEQRKMRAHIFFLKQETENLLGIAQIFETLKSIPSDILPPSRPYLLILTKLVHQLEIKSSNTWLYGGHSHPNHCNGTDSSNSRSSECRNITQGIGTSKNTPNHHVDCPRKRTHQQTLKGQAEGSEIKGSRLGS